jgi:hypothetical protein
VRRDHIDALGDAEARRVCIDHEGRQALGARRLARAREHDVEASDAAVRDPRLLAVEDVMIAIAPRRGRQRGDIRPGLRLRQREGRDRLAGGDIRQITALECVAAEQRDRSAAEPLHGQREIG